MKRNDELDAVAREKRFRALLAEWEKLAAEAPIFREGYLEEIRPNSHAAHEGRRAADGDREPKK
jgi:hypothetical protein